MSERQSWVLDDETQMVGFGQALGHAARPQATVFLQGDLGMGKTTMCRGVVQSFGHQGVVKSPTYTLVEPYRFDAGRVYHFDLYRLADPEELEYLGIRDYFDTEALRLIEWPERGEGVLPQPDLQVEIELAGTGRRVVVKACSVRGKKIIEALKEGLESQLNG